MQIRSFLMGMGAMKKISLSDEIEDERERKKLPETGGWGWVTARRHMWTRRKWACVSLGNKRSRQREELVQKLNLYYHESSDPTKETSSSF